MKLKNTATIESRDEQRERNKIWRSLVQVYGEFARESSIHGIKYTVQAKTPIERLLWLIVIVISLICSVQLANQFYARHKSGNMRTTVITNQYPSVNIAVPAVTLCQGHLVSAARLKHFLSEPLNLPRALSIKDFENGLQYLQAIVNPSMIDNHAYGDLANLQRILTAINMTIPQLLEKVSPSCTDLLITCRYEGSDKKKCHELFESTLTPYGICCSFNYGMNGRGPDPKVQNQIYSKNFGSSYILSVLLKPYNTSDRIAPITYGDGYKVIIHEKYTLPGPNSVEFMAGEAHETIAGLLGTKLVSSPEVISSHERTCRISEKNEIYRTENCYVECRNEFIKELCDCTPFYSVKESPHDVFCNLTSIPCLAENLSDVYSLSLQDSRCQSKNCLPDCNNFKYGISITGIPFNAAGFKPGSFYKIATKYPKSTALHITFASQVSVLEQRDLVFTWINIMSSLGGVFSLFLGCSFISVIEFVYFFTFQLIKILQLKYKGTSPVLNTR